MADNTLFQALIDDALTTRVEAIKRKFRITNSALMRVALERMCEHLESLPDPFDSPPFPVEEHAKTDGRVP